MFEILGIAAFIFGAFWKGANVMALSPSEFLMLYGGLGAVICEIVARGLKGSAKFEEEKVEEKEEKKEKEENENDEQ